MAEPAQGNSSVSLGSKVRLGLAWTTGTRLASQFVTWLITIVVMRVLTPADYGLLAMATVFVGLLSLVSEAGLGAALVQARELDGLKLRRAFAAVIVVDVALFLLQFAAAPVIARFFEEPRLSAIVRILAIQFLLMIWTVVPGAQLMRALDFRRASMIALGTAVGGSLITLALALAGYGVWALVLGSLGTQLLNTFALNAVSPFLKWPDFSLKGMRELVVFGGEVTAARIVWFLYSQADIFIAGKLLGKEMLGFYSVSMHVSSLPVQRISSIVNQVAYPAFAQAQGDLARVPAYILKAVRMLSFFAFPVCWGISSIADELVAVVLGTKWHAAVTPLRLLPLIMPITILSPFLNTAFQGIGKSRIVFMNVLTALIAMPIAFWFGARWGLLGLSLAWVCTFPLVFLINLHRMLPLVGLRLSDIVRAGTAPGFAAAVMYACVEACRYALDGRLGALATMAALVASGAAVYAAVMLLTDLDGIREVVDVVRG